MKPGTPPLRSVRLLDQVRERIRYLHYSLSTEKVYLYWVRFFIRWNANSGQMRHPRDMGASEVEAFLTMLATERKVSASTRNQALSALLFLYREVLGIDLPWLNNINRPANKRRIPSVLTSSWNGHSNSSRTSGPQRCEHHHDLHPRSQGCGRWNSKSFGRIDGVKMITVGQMGRGGCGPIAGRQRRESI